MTKFIFVIGGVVSGVGKGIIAASIGFVLKNANKKVFLKKFDPYLNIDPGTISPLQHGEVFVTDDGAETDLDLGHYERFTNTNLDHTSNLTSGKIYQELIHLERSGKFLGQTIQVIPHVTNLIKSKILDQKNNYDVVIIEVGGTIGDIESLPFIESIRQIKMDLGKENVCIVHVGLLPFLNTSYEYKTKPIQHSISILLSQGIQADLIVARSIKKVSDEVLNKIAIFCNLKPKFVLNAYNVKSIYNVPNLLYDQNLINLLNLKLKWNLLDINLEKWNKLFKNFLNPNKRIVEVYIVGKYTKFKDSYLSLVESLNLTGLKLNLQIEIIWINSKKINLKNYQEILKNAKIIIIPGGFDCSGVDGMILAAKFARINNISFLGICLGLDISAIEIALNLCHLKDASSFEFNPKSTNLIIDQNKNVNSNNFQYGGTLRLGKYKVNIFKNTLLASIYQNKDFVFERHRHRYEFNNKYKTLFQKQNVVFSGIYQEKNLIEAFELTTHKFYLAVQYHPEFLSRINNPHPIFINLVKSIL